MVADIKVDFAQARSACNAFIAKKEDVKGVLTALRTDVQRLLTTDGGLFLRQSSPAFDNSYSQFNANMLKTIENIESFAKSWTDIVNQLEKMDGQMKSSIEKSGG